MHKNITLTEYQLLRYFLVSTSNFPWFCVRFCGASSPTTALVCSLLYYNFPRFLLLGLRLCANAFSFTTPVRWWYIKQTEARFRGQKTNTVFDDQFTYIQLCDWCCCCGCWFCDIVQINFIYFEYRLYSA